MKTRKMPQVAAPVVRLAKGSAPVAADAAISASNYGGDASGGVGASHIF
jgi:hypothetical protein